MADMTFAVTISGNINGKRVSWSRTATLVDVDDAIQAHCESGGGDPDFFTVLNGGQVSTSQHSYDGCAAVMVVGQNTGGLNWLVLQGSSDYAAFGLSTGIPFIAYNGGGFNGMFAQGTTATANPSDDVTGYLMSPLGGRNKYSAIGALKAIS